MGNAKFELELAGIDAKVIEMFALVRSAIPAATDALLAEDRQIARAIQDRDELINQMSTDIEGLTVLPARMTMAMRLEFDAQKAEVESQYRDELQILPARLRKRRTRSASRN